MVEIGGQPILWHIMKGLAHHGVTDFVICTGYRGEVIKDYFLNYEGRAHDFTVRLGQPAEITYHSAHDEADWQVTIADTGQITMTGGRVKRIQDYIGDQPFIVTYGDGLANIDIRSLVDFHESHHRLATITAIRPWSRFGIMDIDGDTAVERFREKPLTDDYVNGGFFVFEPGVFDYLDDDCVLEQTPLEALAKDGQLMAFRHEGFWQPMDTYREFTMLNEMWDRDEAPWKVWG